MNGTVQVGRHWGGGGRAGRLYIEVLYTEIFNHFSFDFNSIKNLRASQYIYVACRYPDLVVREI